MSSTLIRRAAARTAATLTCMAVSVAAFAAPAQADEQHRVKSGDTVSAIALRYGSSVTGIVSANGLNSRALIVVGQVLTVPTGTSSTSAPTASASTATTSVTHTVRTGDTVWALARSYGTTVSAIIKANSLNSSATIRVGQKLKVAGATPSTSTAAKTTTTVAKTTSTSTSALAHTVRSGDTVWDLARTYGTSVSAIIKANNLGTSAIIRVGQKLTIAGGTTPGAAAATEVNNGTASSGAAPQLATEDNLAQFGGVSVAYTVKSGDSLHAIAARHGVTVDAIVKANGIKNPSVITIGQKLTIPGGTPTDLVGDTFAGQTYSAPVVGAANQNKATLLSMDVPSRAEMQQMVIRIAKEFGLDPALAQAIAYQESGFNMQAVSPANAIGTMQVIPTSGEWASTMVGRKLNLLVPEDNVTAGVAILTYLTRPGRDLDKAIAGYYQGEGAVNKYGIYNSSKNYVASVLALKARFE